MARAELPSIGLAGDVTIPIDVARLLETRLLVTAASGQGKSYLLRRAYEQTAPFVQQILIDPEGEFASLREKFDYLICAPHDGDAIATPRTAALLARRLLETGVSAIIDIYDLKAHERYAFVRMFCEALVNAPKKLWKPVLVGIDELHVFAPEKGSAESLPAVIDLASRGRKRGFALVGATQRLSKLHKDVAAELLNKLIGGMSLDIDVRRAADELGMTPKQAAQELRLLNPGEFFAYGPALCRDVTKVQIGAVVTTHPEPGQRLMTAPPAPSKKVLAILKALADLPQQAEQEAHTLEDLRAQLRQARSELTKANKRAEQAGVPEKEVLAREQAAVKKALAERPPVKVSGDSPRHRKALEKIVAIGQQALQEGSVVTDSVKVAVNEPVRPAPRLDTADGISGPQQRILDTLAKLELYGIEQADKAMLAAHSGVRPTSGSYANNLGRLRTLGLVEYPAGGVVVLTADGRSKAHPPTTTPTLDEMHASWMQILSGPQQKLLRVIVDCYPRAISKDALAHEVGVSSTSGSYANNLGRMRTLGAIDYPRQGMVRASDRLFPKGVDHV